MPDRWSVASAVGVPLLAGALLAVPAVREEALTRLAHPVVLPVPPSAAPQGLPPLVDAGARTGWQTRVWPPPADPADSIHRSVVPPAPGPPERPRPPRPPWLQRPPAAAPATARPVQLGPVQRLRRTVAEGGSVPLPAGSGVPHVLCAGPTTPRAQYWIDTTGGGYAVRRYDLSGEFDLYYRYASDPYVQRAACE